LAALWTLHRITLATGCGVALVCVAGAAEDLNASRTDFQDDPTCAVDQTQKLRDAIARAAGGSLTLPSGTICLKSERSTITVAAPNTEIAGRGRSTVIKWSAPQGSPIAPIIDILPTADHVTLRDIGFDHNAEAGNYRPSDYFGTNPWGGIAVSIQADDFSGDKLWVRNGFDNCIGVSRIDPANQRAKPGLPQRFTLSNIHTENCGSGRHAVERGGPGRIGAGIDNGSGSAGVIENVVDFRSYGSFIADLGAGAYASWSNVTSFYSRVDERKDTPALYVGAPYNSFTNVSIIAPQGRGIWSDRYAAGSLFANVTIKSAGGPCLFIKGGAQWSNVNCVDPSFAAPGTQPAILVDSSAGPIAALSIRGFAIATPASHPSYAIQMAGDHRIDGVISALDFAGPIAPPGAALERAGLQIEGLEGLKGPGQKTDQPKR
jgi:hypothetical protein